jgi:phage protein D/phage baseplate assembly protein gpV
MRNFYAPDFEVKIQGAVMEADVKSAVTSLKYDNNMDQADMFQLTLDNAGLRFTDAALFEPGKDVEIYMGYAGDLQPMMLGEIVAVSPSFPAEGAPTLSVTGYDKSHRMRHNSVDRDFKRVNDSLIAAQVAAENLLIPVVDPSPMLPEDVSHIGSDWALLAERARRNYFQIYVYWDKLYFRFPRPQVERVILEWGKNLGSFSPRLSTSGQAGMQVVRGYDAELAQTIVSILPTLSLDMDFDDLAERLGSSFVEGLVKFGRNFVHKDSINNFFDATVFAKSVLQQILDGLFEGSGNCIGIPNLRAGNLVEIRGVGKRFSGSYTLNKVTHTISQSGYQTRFDVSQKYNTSLTSQLRKGISDLPSPNRRERINGFVVGIVTKNSGDKKGLSRVKVKFPELSDVIESKWAPVVTPMVGSGRGIYFLPEVGDQVLVGFRQGDIDKPFILGGFWSSKAPPPEKNLDGRNRRRLIRTESGMELLFDETDGKQHLLLKDKKGSTIKMDAESGDILIEAKGNVVINKGSKGVDEVKGAARKDDPVEVTIPENTFIVSVSGGGGNPAVGLLNPGPVKVEGRITSASGSVKAGD